MEPILLGPDYEMTIHPAIVERLGLKPGWSCIQYPFHDHIEVRFVPPGPNGPSHAGILAPFIEPEIGERIGKMTEDQWLDGIREAAERGPMEDWLEKEKQLAPQDQL
jgi:hypothetical protein